MTIVDSMQSSHDTALAVILAAGLGKRMGSDLPKVVLPFHGRPMIQWVVESARAAGIGQVIAVIGHKGEMVMDALAGANVEFVWQHELLGTAHAVLQARSYLTAQRAPVLVLLGDVPAIRPRTIRAILEEHTSRNAAATVLTAVVEDPTGYGRILRTDNGRVRGIVEERDADAKIKSIKEINTGVMCFHPQHLLDSLGVIGKDNSQGEYYLTDAIKILVDNGLLVNASTVGESKEASGVNSMEQLSELEHVMPPPGA